MNFPSKKNPSEQASASLYALIGILVVLAIAIVANWIVGSLGWRLDLTEDKIYTLSDGTRSIIDKIDSEAPVAIRYYVTEDARAMPDQLKTYARNVQDLLDSYRKASRGKITVERYDPAPDTDEEDKAVLDGIPAQSLNFTDAIRFGISISSLDKQSGIPTLDPSRETLLEYDLSRAISEVISDAKPVLGIMSALPVGGPAFMLPPQMGGGGQQPPWFIHQALSRDYDVQDVAPSVASIPAEVNVLLLIHPGDLTPGAQFAIDQFVLRGGKLIACIDPHCIAAQMSQPQPNPMMGGQQPPPAPTSSNMQQLLSTWGINFDNTKVAADLNNATELQGGQKWPGILTLTGDAVNADDIATANLTDLTLVFAGAFSGEPAEGLSKESLIRTSETVQLVNNFDAENNDASITSAFQSNAAPMDLAIRLSGKFKTAFPNGAPTASPEPAEGNDAQADPSALTEGESAVILIGDADFIFDQFCVQLMQVMGGGAIPRLRNSNIPLMQNITDQFAGDSDLIQVRSRASTRRPFDKFKEMTAGVEQAHNAKAEELEMKRQNAQREITELQAARSDDQSEFLTAEQQTKLEELQESYAQGGKELREVRKTLTKDIDRLESKITIANVLAMPILVSWIGIGLAFYRKSKTSAR